MIGSQLALMSDEEVAGYGRSPEAGFGALATARGRLPLVALDVEVRVVGVVATTEIAQVFVNTTGAAIEATYIFPLPDRAAVHRFRMEVAGRIVEGEIDERGAARASYDAAIAAGHRAAIAEEERSGVFTLRVGNLMPGEAATVRLSLIGALPVDDGEVTFRFPLVVAPRYIPGLELGGDQAGVGSAGDTDVVPDASRISPPVLLPGCPNPVRLALRVAIEDGVMREIASSLHAVIVARRDAQVVEVQPGERLDRDFVLRWRVDGDALRSSLVCADDPGGGGGTFALTLVPPSTSAVGARPRDVVFVIDRSGSMEGWKIVAARRSVARMIDSLTSRDRFSVLAFDNTVDAVPEAGLLQATDRQRFRTVEAIARIEARGGTEIAQPLAKALASLDGGTADRERVVVLVTDGQVGNEDDVLRRTTPGLRNIRMFTLGIDQAVNAGFLRRLAAAGGGLCELVESEDRLDAVMAKVHRRIGTPIATELALRATGLDIDRATLAPAKLPDVYAGAPVVIFGRYRGAGPGAVPGALLDVEGTSLGDPLRMSVAAKLAPQAASWLAACWARAHIRDLEDRYAAGARGLEHEIVRVSKRFRVLSRFTAFVAIDSSQVANRGGVLHQVVQPVEAPAGWDTSAAGSGAAGMASTIVRVSDVGGGRSSFASSRRAAPPPTPAPAAEPRERGGRLYEIMPPSPYAPSGPIATPPSPALQQTAVQPHAAPPAMAPPPRFDLPLELEVEVSPSVFVGYLHQLALFAVELTALAKGSCSPAAIRVLRERLTQWLEDLRSVGGDRDLATAVEDLVARLTAALAAPATLRDEVTAIADALARLATGARTPPGSRPAFWK